MAMSTSNVIVGSSANPKAGMALSSLIHALNELESYAVARFVRTDGQGPKLLLLDPLIEPNFEAFIDVELPFAEDVRTYRFPPLDRVETVGGKIVKEHSRLPDDKLQAAMDDLVDSMDLSDLDDEEEYGVFPIALTQTS